MRHEIYRMHGDEAVALLQRAPVVRLASTTPEGRPLLRAVHGVVVDDALAFHGAPAGDKTLAIGREAVLAADEIVASIPSYFVDPERACPATTFYRSVQVEGCLRPVEDMAHKSRVLEALMRRFQPEGGYLPIDPGDRMYREVVRKILVVEVPLDRLSGKAKLGQNRTGPQLNSIVEQLWARGEPGDPAAIELVRAHNASMPTPTFLASPAGTRLWCQLDDGHLGAASAMLAGEYWNEGFPPAAIEAAHRASVAWVGATDDEGRLIATARANGDGERHAWILDVAVAPAWRRRGLGDAVMRLLLDHPRVRRAANVGLATRDAQTFYARLGFVERLPRHTMMVRAPASAARKAAGPMSAIGT